MGKILVHQSLAYSIHFYRRGLGFELVREYYDGARFSAIINPVCSRVHISWASRMDVLRKGWDLLKNTNIFETLNSNWNDTKLIYIYIYLYSFKEAKLISIKYRKILISTQKLKFTKLFQSIRPTACTYKYIYMTSIHYYMFRLLSSIIRKPHQHTKLSELWHNV